MTTPTRTFTSRPGLSSVRAVGRQFARIGTPARRLRIHMAEIAMAGQLGSDAETEIGRRTGARV